MKRWWTLKGIQIDDITFERLRKHLERRKALKTETLIYLNSVGNTIRNSLNLLIIALSIFIFNYYYERPLQIVPYIFNSLSESVFIIVIVAYLFNKFLWKCKVFRKWLVLIQNLNGKWNGFIHSDWVNPDTKEKRKPIETSLFIKQSLFHISCVMKNRIVVRTTIKVSLSLPLSSD